MQDAWLDNIDWTDLNSFQHFQKKKYELDDGAQEDKIDESTQNKENSEDDGTDDDSMNAADSKDFDQTDLFKKIFEFLKPNENILNAIKRLGKSNTSKTSASLSASQRWLKKKTPNQASGGSNDKNDIVVEKKIKEDALALDTLTSLANKFIDMGYYDIYEETYEKINFKINIQNRKIEDVGKSQFDIFADDVDVNVLQKRTETVVSSVVEGELGFLLF